MERTGVGSASTIARPLDQSCARCRLFRPVSNETGEWDQPNRLAKIVNDDASWSNSDEEGQVFTGRSEAPF